MNEKELIQAAESGDVSAMKTLANFYAQRARGKFEDKIGDVISIKSLDEILSVPREKEDPELEAKAYKYYLMAAEAGDAESMTEVARRIYKRNWQGEEYKIWYRRGAEAGDPAAMHVVAFISEDEKEKFKWFKLSAELDKPGLNKQDSIKQTAINYACGRGTEKDIAKAEEWLAKLDKDDENSARMEIARITGESSWMEQAAEFSPMAMVRLAEDFVQKNDFVSALKWYKKAAHTKRKAKADSWAIAAMSIIGDIYYIGDGVEQSYAEAFKWYSRAAKLGYNMAKIKRTLMIYRGLGVEQNLEQAFKNFSEISWTREDFGHFSPFRFNSVARYYAAKMRDNGEGCTKDIVDAFERYRVAGGLERVADYETARSIPKAIYKVADAYFLGEGVRQNFDKALKFYEKTFSQGDGRTPYHLEAVKKAMWMYELGEGIPQDKAKADELRKKLNGSNENDEGDDNEE